MTVQKIQNALKGFDDLKSLEVDGFGAKFFKACWNTIKENLIAGIRGFFYQGKLFRAFYNNVVTLVPKHAEAKTIKDYRPIGGCITFDNIISKVLTARLERVIGSIISQ